MTNILAISGRKQSGKNTIANFIIGLKMVELKLTKNFKVLKEGLWVSDILGDSENNSGILDVSLNDENVQMFLNAYLNPFVRMYSFADMLKKNVCMDVLGLSYEQCYGTDKQKNAPTDIKWEDTPTALHGHPNGHMTAREVMQYVGTDILRKMHPNVWVDAALRKIRHDNPETAIICDCRFPNEVEGVQKCGGRVIRLTRNGISDDVHLSETALDRESFDWNNFDAIIDNEGMTIAEQNEKIYKTLRPWGFVPEVKSV